VLRLPDQWPQRVKSALLHAIALAGVAITAAQGRLARTQQLRARIDQAENEIALLREELAIKDGRWRRSDTRRRPHYLPEQRLRILQLRAARSWTLEKTASVFLIDHHTLQLWVQRVDKRGEHELLKASHPANRYPDFIRYLVRQLKRHFPAMGCERIALILGRLGLILSASTVARIVREPRGPGRDAQAAFQFPRVYVR
jgi:acyl transferase domain-containing protein